MDGDALRKLLDQGPLLADGGMATSFVERGADVDSCFDVLNVERPDLVATVHRAFAAAGARLVETNTFGANRFALAKAGLEHKVTEINRAGAEIARAHVPRDVLVAGSVGPLRVRLAPYGRVRPAEAHRAYAEQIAALVAGGVDLIVIETQSDLNEMEQALDAARKEAPALAVVVTATFTRDDRTLLGSPPELVARRLHELGADALGVNCSEGPAQVLRIIHAMRPHAGGTPLVAMPNAGGPARVGERIMYPATAEYLGDYARSFVAAGASIVGGCCGTSPEHIAAMAAALERPQQLDLELLPYDSPDGQPEQTQVTTELGRKLAEGKFVVAVEMDPPRGFSPARLLAGAETLRDAGADVINVADSPMARMRMSPWAPCALIQEHVGVECVLHFPTRGRNLLRIQGDLLAAHALGIRNLFVMMGDPTSVGDYPHANDASDVVPTGLISLVTQSLNRGREQSGASIGEPTSFLVGCAVNLNPPDLARECRLMKKKVDAGAGFAMSMPVWSSDVVRLFRKAYEDRYGELSVPILAGVLPLVTSRHAEFLHNELPGALIPPDVRARMRDAGPAAEEEGLRIAVEVARAVRGEAAGVYVMPPFGRVDLGAEVVEAVRTA